MFVGFPRFRDFFFGTLDHGARLLGFLSWGARLLGVLSWGPRLLGALDHHARLGALLGVQNGLVLLGGLVLSGAVRPRVSARLLLAPLGRLLRIGGTPRKSVSPLLPLSADGSLIPHVWSAWAQAVPVARRRAESGCTVAVG